MAQLSPRDGAVLLEAIGICIDHGNPGLGAQISQWLATKKAQEVPAPTHRVPRSPQRPRLEVVASMEH